MRHWLGLAALVALAAPSRATAPAPEPAATSNDEMPPPQFRGRTTFTITIGATQDEIERHCGKASSPKKVKIGCAVGRNVYLGDSCEFGDLGETFARWVCHEAAHVRGWTGDHPDSRPPLRRLK